jgi:hypothetical protein
MTHLSESELLRAADGDPSAPASAHLTTCDECRMLVEDQRAAHAMLAARPILPARDLSAAIRATLDAEAPSGWLGLVDRLNINWRLWSFRVAPIAAVLAVVATLAVRTVDTSNAANTATVATDTTTASASDASSTVVSALWSDDVSDDTLFNLFLTARPDDALGSYVPANK